jgi:hypothetical protein
MNWYEELLSDEERTERLHAASASQPNKKIRIDAGRYFFNDGDNVVLIERAEFVGDESEIGNAGKWFINDDDGMLWIDDTLKACVAWLRNRKSSII